MERNVCGYEHVSLCHIKFWCTLVYTDSSILYGVDTWFSFSFQCCRNHTVIDCKRPTKQRLTYPFLFQISIQIVFAWFLILSRIDMLPASLATDHFSTTMVHGCYKTGSSKLFGTWAKMLSAIFNRAKSCKHEKYRILYNVYIYIHEHLFYFVDICVAGKHTVGPTIKVQHRDMLEKNQSSYILYSQCEGYVLLLVHVSRWLEGLSNSA